MWEKTRREGEYFLLWFWIRMGCVERRRTEIEHSLVALVTWVQFKQVHIYVHRCRLLACWLMCVCDSLSMTMVLNSKTSRFQFHTRLSPKNRGKKTEKQQHTRKIMNMLIIPLYSRTRVSYMNSPEESEPSPLKHHKFYTAKNEFLWWSNNKIFAWLLYTARFTTETSLNGRIANLNSKSRIGWKCFGMS